MSELNTSPLLTGDKNKGDYISSVKLAKDEAEERINNKSVPDKTNQVVRDCAVFQKKKRRFCN